MPQEDAPRAWSKPHGAQKGRAEDVLVAQLLHQRSGDVDERRGATRRVHRAGELLYHDGQRDGERGGQPDVAAEAAEAQQVVHQHAHEAAQGVA